MTYTLSDQLLQVLTGVITSLLHKHIRTHLLM